ncbi:MAG: NADPH:quinone oxidoreductase family protein [Geminicoccaceae bacterium]
MRAMICRALGGPEVLEAADLPDPTPGPGEVRIRVRAAGVNFADSLMLKGTYQEKPPLPFVPGLEIAGEIDALGDGVTGLAMGRRVLAVVDRGGFAELAIARAADVVPIHDGMDFPTAAGFPIAYGTAYGGLVWRADLKAGETVLVHGAAGGVGLTAVEVGKALGARVIATARGDERAEIARRYGADIAHDSELPDLKDRIRGVCSGGVEVVYDPIGGALFDLSLRCIAWEGRLVVIGFASGEVPQIPANLLLVKNAAALGFYWGSYRHHAPDRVRSSFEQLLQWHREGKINPLISETVPLERTGEAIGRLVNRRASGKVVVTVG